jgi:signal transduction histidine kinase/ligand-binding sensor domain-containing protein/CheY-like chemotaxis protein/AraC-like DNA-binding protein
MYVVRSFLLTLRHHIIKSRMKIRTLYVKPHFVTVAINFFQAMSLLFLIVFSMPICASDLFIKQTTLNFKRFSSHIGSQLCDETSVAIQDNDGFIWIGTRLGLNRYDGYSVRTYKNDINHPHLFTSADIKCIADDGKGHLWFGTFSGLNMMDKHTGKVKQYHFDNRGGSDYINSVICHKDGNVWVGNDNGLSVYDRQTDRFHLLRGRNIPNEGVKSIMEDSRGYIWIGTRQNGVYRYSIRNRRWFHLPQVNKINYAQVVFEDSRHRIWIGSLGCGLSLVMNPYDENGRQKVVVMNRGNSGIASDFINTIAENPIDHTLWIGTVEGVSVRNKSGAFINYPDQKMSDEWNDMNRGINNIIADKDGRLWMCVNNGGVITADISPRLFTSFHLKSSMLSTRTDIINSIATDKNKNLWLGLNNCGLALCNISTGLTTLCNFTTSRNGISEQSEVNKVFVTSDGTLLAGTRKDGILVYKKGRLTGRYDMSNSPWLKNNCVYSFLELGSGNFLVGTWTGLCLMNIDGRGRYISRIGTTDISRIHILAITRTGRNEYWLSLIFGIIHITGDINHPETMRAKVYSYEGTSPSVSPPDAFVDVSSKRDPKHYHLGGIFKMLKDHHGRIWACTSEPGLLLYDSHRDAFVCVSHLYGIPGDNVHSMEEDRHGCLWLSTNEGIARLHLSDHTHDASLKMFTAADGLPDNYYGNAASCSLGDGRICFGNYNSVTIFSPDDFTHRGRHEKACITDIKIFNQSISEMDSGIIHDITSFLPPYTKQITLKPHQNDIQIDFSTFKYNDAHAVRYAYRLDEHDENWIFTEGSNHVAYYSNLQPGTYTFRLKTINDDGTWSNIETRIVITVLPPLWLCWWAYLVYFILLIAAVYVAYLLIRRSERQKQAVRVARMEQEKTEELNHKKMQFFTNITHDLMTPLTVISATVDSLRNADTFGLTNNRNTHPLLQFDIIQNNINRLMRLLQQILEFRKVETGNLSLQVSTGDMIDFCRHEVESIAPLMKSKNQTVSFVCTEEHFECMFDTDVVDKIIYNLLSNASKYNRSSGSITLTLEFIDDHSRARLTVTDTGYGLTEQQLSNIFSRFYEGEHRHFNTYGTGIGLSLTHDLVTLHHGSIHVNSIKDVGTTFTVILPVEPTAFAEEEIDNRDSVLVDTPVQTTSDIALYGDGFNSNMNNDRVEENASATILFVEDNSELCSVVKKLLSNEYHVITATNGREALEIIRSDKDHIDMVVSDIMMPEIDGIEMTKIIKNDVNISHIPVLLLTAKNTDEDRTEAYDVGADAYLTKPFKLSLLDARIHNLLRRRQQSAADFRSKYVVELSDIPLTDIDKDFMKKCTEIIQRHISDSDLDQQMLICEIGTSHSTLYRKLKTLTGMDATVFIRNIRMKAACSIIEKNPDVRISELAYSVGYSNPKYFATCFRNEFGMTPTEYVKKFK